MNTLLHICCAPCANQCIEVLRADGYDVTGLWYNPNIHPLQNIAPGGTACGRMPRPLRCRCWSEMTMACGRLSGP